MIKILHNHYIIYKLILFGKSNFFNYILLNKIIYFIILLIKNNTNLNNIFQII